MYSLDIETLSVNQTAVILSIGIVYFVPTKETHTYEEIMQDSLFLKLSVKPQVEKLKREVLPSTIDWWKKQDEISRKFSFSILSTDLDPAYAIQQLRKFIYDRTGQDKNVLCFTRGSMDSIVVDHLCSQVGEPLPFVYNQYRDFRTAIDILYKNSKGGYVDVDPQKCPGFSRDKVIKHMPVHDCAYDLAMLHYGKTE